MKCLKCSFALQQNNSLSYHVPIAVSERKRVTTLKSRREGYQGCHHWSAAAVALIKPGGSKLAPHPDP